MLNFDPNQVVIYTLVFVLGLLVGGFLFTGGGRKWKGRYNAEVDRRKEIEERHVAAEKEWRNQEKLHAAALKERPVVVERAPVVAPVAAAGTTAGAVPVIDRDVTHDRSNEPLLATKKPSGFVDKMLGRDKDGDGVKDRNDGFVDRDGDGVDDRR
jgi:hypothetical protein